MKKTCLFVMPAILLLGCGSRVEHYATPDQVTDFTTLYGSNCAGCHGGDGRSGPARPVNDPVLLAVIGKEKLRETISKGVPRSAMPAFAQNAGGSLTDAQIAILAEQIEKRWSRPEEFAAVTLPSYTADSGDAKAGEAVFHIYCARCHGEDGTGGPDTGSAAGSVVDPSYLALVSDQSLRLTVIAGRIDRGAPDWRNNSPGRPMTTREVSDVVAWLSAHRERPVDLTQIGMKLP